MALIPEDPKQRNALVIGLLMVVGLYFFHAYWYTPRNTENDRMETRLTTLETDNQRARVMATRGGEELRERLGVYERHISQLERLIPASGEVSALLNSIAGEARTMGVNLHVMNPENIQAGDFYERHSYLVEVVGEFHDVARFLTAIASLSRVVTPFDLNLTLYTGPNPPEGEAPVNARFRIQTYVLPPGSSPSAVTTAADGVF
jgi:type IV pilus assembly protein PilO